MGGETTVELGGRGRGRTKEIANGRSGRGNDASKLMVLLTLP